MKFKISADHRFWWSVTIHLPDPDKANATLTQTFKMQYRMLPLDEARELSGAPPEDQAALADLQAATIRKVAVDWDDSVVDDHGMKIPFSPEALDLAMQIGAFRIGVIEAYGEAISKGQKRGN